MNTLDEHELSRVIEMFTSYWLAMMGSQMKPGHIHAILKTDCCCNSLDNNDLD